jgi:hypothetical protein
MSYRAAYLLSEDDGFWTRVGMCYEEQGSDFESGVSARHTIAASPGFPEKYEYALETGVENPGWNPAVISDAEILAAVQLVLNGPTPDTIPDAGSTRQERLAYLHSVGVHGVDALSDGELLDLIRDLVDSP